MPQFTRYIPTHVEYPNFSPEVEPDDTGCGWYALPAEVES